MLRKIFSWCDAETASPGQFVAGIAIGFYFVFAALGLWAGFLWGAGRSEIWPLLHGEILFPWIRFGFYAGKFLFTPF